jgi:tRNA A-37 threonylcarbamoyl transferase component Bud32
VSHFAALLDRCVVYEAGAGVLARLPLDIFKRWRSEKKDLLRLEKALYDSRERRKNLKEALKDSRTCMEELNIRRKNNGERKMGALAPVSRGPEEANTALASYDDWVKKHVSNELADKADEAMKALCAALTNSATVDLVLGLPARSRSLVKFPLQLVRGLKEWAGTWFERASEEGGKRSAAEQRQDSCLVPERAAEGRGSAAPASRFVEGVKSLVKSLSHMAMAVLKAALTISALVESVLGLKRGSATDNNLKQACKSADEALDAEKKQQESDALGEFPCDALLRAGDHLSETWQNESAAIDGLLQAYRMLQEEIRLNNECLDNSGTRSKDKDKAVLELRKAREEHKALTDLSMLKKAREDGEEKQKLGVLGILKVARVLGIWKVASVMCSSETRISLEHITDATFKLSGEIQPDFPEVVLFIRKGLPPDLAALWRPPQSLDDGFDNKEPVPTESRHRVWRVRQGGAEFAIKEYCVEQASDLHTCLKEAAIIYQQRHAVIVGIKALFQGSGENRKSFYVQMPWYQHGSLDKWVDSNQRLKWPTVRTVLQDALVGLDYLHDNGVIHSDVNPQNILVDSRERGCLADFDMSIDTKARTSAAHLNASKTMRGTQDAGTAGFDAPELVSSRQATRHTDIFAYGKTVQAVERRCEPEDGADIHGNMGRGQTAELISALTSPIPESRPSAKNAMQDPFFAVLKDVPTAELDYVGVGPGGGTVPETESVDFEEEEGRGGIPP